MTYFAFTSLSTVGFGDYYPTNNFERIMCSIIIFFGNFLFGLIITNFDQMMFDIKKFMYDSDDAENLSKFFNLIAKFNKGKQINLEIRERIEKHFEFKWNNDRKSVVSDKVAMEWMS